MSIEADLKHLDGVKEEYEYGFHDAEKAVYKSGRGLNHPIGCVNSAMKPWIFSLPKLCQSGAQISAALILMKFSTI